MCGKEAVPTIIQIASEINFQAAIPPSATPACDTEIDFNPPGTPADFTAAAEFLTRPYCCSSSPNQSLFITNLLVIK